MFCKAIVMFYSYETNAANRDTISQYSTFIGSKMYIKTVIYPVIIIISSFEILKVPTFLLYLVKICSDESYRMFIPTR